MSQPHQENTDSGPGSESGSSSSDENPSSIPKFVFPDGAVPGNKVITGRPDLLPWWLQIDPAWAQELEDFNTANNTDILYYLQTFGMRWASDNDYSRFGFLWTDFDTYVEDQPKNEEGWAQEHWVRICGKQTPLLPKTCVARLTFHTMHLIVLWRDSGTVEWLPCYERGEDHALRER